LDGVCVCLGHGVRSIVIDSIEQDAVACRINKVNSTVLYTHPERDEVHDWLLVRGYKGNESDASLRKRVGDELPEPAASPAPTSVPEGSRASGQEESGDYVDVESHKY